jgi:hypothetical protein
MTGQHRTQRLTIFPYGVLFWPIIPAIDGTHKEDQAPIPCDMGLEPRK